MESTTVNGISVMGVLAFFLFSVIAGSGLAIGAFIAGKMGFGPLSDNRISAINVDFWVDSAQGRVGRNVPLDDENKGDLQAVLRLLFAEGKEEILAAINQDGQVVDEKEYEALCEKAINNVLSDGKSSLEMAAKSVTESLRRDRGDE